MFTLVTLQNVENFMGVNTYARHVCMYLHSYFFKQPLVVLGEAVAYYLVITVKLTGKVDAAMRVSNVSLDSSLTPGSLKG